MRKGICYFAWFWHSPIFAFSQADEIIETIRRMPILWKKRLQKVFFGRIIMPSTILNGGPQGSILPVRRKKSWKGSNVYMKNPAINALIALDREAQKMVSDAQQEREALRLRIHQEKQAIYQRYQEENEAALQERRTQIAQAHAQQIAQLEQDYAAQSAKLRALFAEKSDAWADAIAAHCLKH